MTWTGRAYLQNGLRTGATPQQYQNKECVKLHWPRPSIPFLLFSTCLTVITNSLFIKFIFQAGNGTLYNQYKHTSTLHGNKKKSHLQIRKWALEYRGASPHLDLNSSWKELFMSAHLLLPSSSTQHKRHG